MTNIDVMNSVSNFFINSMLLTDGYKLGHKLMYPKGMTKLYSNFTPRSNKHFPEAANGVLVFGTQYFIKKYLIDDFNNNFFNQPKELVVETYKKLLKGFLGEEMAEQIGTKHIEELHDLGYLPIQIKALPEGVMCPIGVPVLTITNTHPDFAWLVNYLETLISTSLWKPMNNATIADIFKREVIRHAKATGMPLDDNLDFLCHDFSMRGMSGVEDAAVSGMAHLVSFSGSECIPGILATQYYYGAEDNVAGSVAASEHSVECTNATDETEIPNDEKYFKHMLEVFPRGVVSIVADGYDYWKFISEIVPKYKMEILQRNGRVVIRPDSGDPVKIICGDPNSDDPIVRMGSYEMLWNTFGGTINKKGYKVLDTHIGLLYGDSINIKRQREIYAQLEKKGFCASNLVLGIGSFTYNMSTRDNLGFAMKATYCEVDGKPIEIYKDPKTVIGMPKKSLRGLLQVDYPVDNKFAVKDKCTKDEESTGALLTTFKDGKLITFVPFTIIRFTAKENLIANENN